MRRLADINISLKFELQVPAGKALSEYQLASSYSFWLIWMYLLAKFSVQRYLPILIFLGELLWSHLAHADFTTTSKPWMPRAEKTLPTRPPRGRLWLYIGKMLHQKAVCILKTCLLLLLPSSSQCLLSVNLCINTCAILGFSKAGAVVLGLARGPHMKPLRLEQDSVMGHCIPRQWIPAVNHTPPLPTKEGIFCLLNLNKASTPVCFHAVLRTISYVCTLLWPSYSAAFWNCQSLTHQSLLVSAGFYYSLISEPLMFLPCLFLDLKCSHVLYVLWGVRECDEWALWKCKRSGLRSCCILKFILMALLDTYQSVLKWHIHNIWEILSWAMRNGRKPLLAFPLN